MLEVKTLLKISHLIRIYLKQTLYALRESNHLQDKDLQNTFLRKIRTLLTQNQAYQYHPRNRMQVSICILMQKQNVPRT